MNPTLTTVIMNGNKSMVNMNAMNVATSCHILFGYVKNMTYVDVQDAGTIGYEGSGKRRMFESISDI